MKLQPVASLTIILWASSLAFQPTAVPLLLCRHHRIRFDQTKSGPPSAAPCSFPLPPQLLIRNVATAPSNTRCFQSAEAVSEELPSKKEQLQAASDDDHDGVSGEGSATITQEIFNLVKAIVGAGVLALPAGIAAFANAPSALYPAIFLITAIGILSGYGFGLIGRSCALTGSKSFREAWTKSVSETTVWIPVWVVTLKTVFAILGYSMILKDTFYALALTAGFQVNKIALFAGLTSAVLLPLCLLKDLTSLAPFSLLGSLGMVYTAVAMSIRYFGNAYVPTIGQFAADLPEHLAPAFGTAGATGVFSPSVSILLGMLSTSYMAHFNAPKFYTELRDNTIPRFMKVVGASFGFSIAIFALMASVGFLTFGANSSGLILNNYSTRDALMSVSRIAVALSLVFSYPLAFLGARDSVLDLFKIKNRSTTYLNTLSVGMLSVVTFLATIIPDVSFVLAFAG